MVDLTDLRHDHHGCRLCVRQRAEAADEIDHLRHAVWMNGDPTENGVCAFCEQYITVMGLTDHLAICPWLAEHNRRALEANE
jgi:hypothetical protein